MVRKNFLPRHSRRVAWQVPTVLVFPTILVRCGPRNAQAKGITNLSHEALVFKCLSAQSRRRTLTILVAGRSLAVVAERFVLKTMLDVTRCCSSLCCLENVFVLSCFVVASQIFGSALVPSKDAHRGRVCSHVGGCEVAGLFFFVFFCGSVSSGHAWVCDNTHFAIQS